MKEKKEKCKCIKFHHNRCPRFLENSENRCCMGGCGNVNCRHCGVSNRVEKYYICPNHGIKDCPCDKKEVVNEFTMENRKVDNEKREKCKFGWEHEGECDCHGEIVKEKYIPGDLSQVNKEVFFDLPSKTETRKDWEEEWRHKLENLPSHYIKDRGGRYWFLKEDVMDLLKV